jgi:hypothetical protein
MPPPKYEAPHEWRTWRRTSSNLPELIPGDEDFIIKMGGLHKMFKLFWSESRNAFSRCKCLPSMQINAFSHKEMTRHEVTFNPISVFFS